jgi:hypothetical protein
MFVPERALRSSLVETRVKIAPGWSRWRAFAKNRVMETSFVKSANAAIECTPGRRTGKLGSGFAAGPQRSWETR